MSNKTIDIREHPHQFEELTRLIVKNLDNQNSDVIQFNLVFKETNSEDPMLYLYGSHTCLNPTDHKLDIITTLTASSLKDSLNSGRFRVDNCEIDYDSTKILYFYMVTYFK